MALSSDRIVAATMAAMRAAGFAPDAVAYHDGKSSMELFAQAIADAVVTEITGNGEVKVKLDKGLATWMGNGVVVATDGGASLKASLITADSSNAFSTSTGVME